MKSEGKKIGLIYIIMTKIEGFWRVLGNSRFDSRL